MVFRVSTIQTLVILVLTTTVTYTIFLRWLFSVSSFYNANNVIDPSSSSTFGSGRLQSPPSILINSPIYNELVEVQFRPIRISPSELNKSTFKHEYITKTLSYDEKLFRQLSIPILWLDVQGDVRWNQAAEHGMLNYLTQKQFPDLDRIGKSSMNKKEILNKCRAQSLFILHEHWSGFFSRVLCFIAQFGQTLYSPRIAVLSGAQFSGSRGATDDFLKQGITRYFLPISICSAYQHHPEMNTLKNLIDLAPKAIHISTSHELYENGNSKLDRVLTSTKFWTMDYHHVPIRKWLFDRKQTSVSYSSSIDILSNHSNEHIYAPKNEQNVPIGEWINRNKPDAFSSDLLPNQGKYKLTWQDHVFGSFLRYMFALFFGSQNSPRIEFSVRILTQYWLSYLTDKYSIRSNINIFDELAGVYIRRGDKASEDSFWAKHNRWRNLSLYVKGIVDEEQRRNKTFKYIFVMTDDKSVMRSMQDYANLKSEGTDEPYARQYLRGREILYNVLAPQECFDPFIRIGFDQFLVSMRFLIEHSAFTIGHTDSNVFRFFREVVYAQRQHQTNVQTFTYVQNAPDSLENNTERHSTIKNKLKN
ncbi:unnamed protein product [Rotaria sordida]|uniref:Uncharacterized protein n=1 Tax=Rotaria sordida TaxID=392033 RepID=A0A813YV05_9BILA|nr:unnamed protein product [Rotaria sordida]